MKNIAVLLAIVAATPAAAEQCLIGGNRPGSDVNPAKRLDPGAPQMRCTQTTTERVGPQGQTQQVRSWNFEIK